jgi:hypothetical protein
MWPRCQCHVSRLGVAERDGRATLKEVEGIEGMGMEGMGMGEMGVEEIEAEGIEGLMKLGRMYKWKEFLGHLAIVLPDERLEMVHQPSVKSRQCPESSSRLIEMSLTHQEHIGHSTE